MKKILFACASILMLMTSSIASADFWSDIESMLDINTTFPTLEKYCENYRTTYGYTKYQTCSWKYGTLETKIMPKITKLVNRITTQTPDVNQRMQVIENLDAKLETIKNKPNASITKKFLVELIQQEFAISLYGIDDQDWGEDSDQGDEFEYATVFFNKGYILNQKYISVDVSKSAILWSFNVESDKNITFLNIGFTVKWTITPQDISKIRLKTVDWNSTVGECTIDQYNICLVTLEKFLPKDTVQMYYLEWEFNDSAVGKKIETLVYSSLYEDQENDNTYWDIRWVPLLYNRTQVVGQSQPTPVQNWKLVVKRTDSYQIWTQNDGSVVEWWQRSSAMFMWQLVNKWDSDVLLSDLVFDIARNKNIDTSKISTMRIVFGDNKLECSNPSIWSVSVQGKKMLVSMWENVIIPKWKTKYICLMASLSDWIVSSSMKWELWIDRDKTTKVFTLGSRVDEVQEEVYETFSTRAIYKPAIQLKPYEWSPVYKNDVLPLPSRENGMSVFDLWNLRVSSLLSNKSRVSELEITLFSDWYAFGDNSWVLTLIDERGMEIWTERFDMNWQQTVSIPNIDQYWDITAFGSRDYQVFVGLSTDSLNNWGRDGHKIFASVTRIRIEDERGATYRATVWQSKTNTAIFE